MNRANINRTTWRYFKPLPIASPSVLTEPAVVFGCVWGLTLFLLNLQMTTQIVPMEPGAVYMIGCNIVFAAFLTLCSYRFRFGLMRSFDLIDLNILELYTDRLRLMWIIGTLIEIVVSGGIPLQWAIMGLGATKDYTDFGIPSFHGIMNALYLQLMCSYLLLWKAKGDKSKRTWFYLLLFWPVFMLGRGIFLSVMIQSLGLLLLIRKVKIKFAISLLIMAIGNILFFGFIGNLRGTKNPFAYLISDDWRGFFDVVPDGFLWVYIYVTSGTNNIFYNSANIVPSGHFDKTFLKLLPSVVRDLLGLQVRADNLAFADSNLNVSTMYAGPISDFGLIGGFCFGSTVLIFAVVVYLYARQHVLWGMLCYCVMFQVLIFSVFYDMFFLLPTIMQLVVAFNFGYFLKIRRRAVFEREQRGVARQPEQTA